ncbi:hypothetical protein [Tenacibaculum tangerinum]|uniref:hypothetical protein n=1 Tax=Tenacibaculum tangerinum TaxID=3038772 RepID=UPI002ADDCA93|nr:hypothetical protein [Tenacibaculum tangerinum]
MKKIKKTYRYALWSALYSTLLSVVIAVLSYLLLLNSLGLGAVIVFGVAMFIVSFLIIQYRAERFIYQRVKKMYEDISILDVNDLKRKKLQPILKH